MMLPDVKQERSGWRDLALNDRHRLWGWDCPWADIDSLLANEYDQKKSKALIEYKHERAAPVLWWKDANIQAMVDLANEAKKPAFLCRYAGDFSWWRVLPLNKRAQQYVPQPQEMTEKQWVSLLYRVRGRPMPIAVAKAIDSAGAP